MSFELDIGARYARNAGADLSAKVHFLAKVDTDGDLVLAAAATDSVLGVIVEAAALNAPATVQFAGIAKVKVGSGGVTAGQRLTSDASGQAINAGSAGNRAFGIALESALEGEIAAVALVSSHIATS